MRVEGRPEKIIDFIEGFRKRLVSRTIVARSG
jgi:hypothetical protein